MSGFIIGSQSLNGPGLKAGLLNIFEKTAFD
jgi:hypothetical protein